VIVLEDGEEIAAWMYFCPVRKGNLVRLGTFAKYVNAFTEKKMMWMAWQSGLRDENEHSN